MSVSDVYLQQGISITSENHGEHTVLPHQGKFRQDTGNHR